ncbi:hypothetical protein NBM05_04625 [Rothia sp. AR01]|uniref:Uncharacterized protein n=1 Tax=Rothia santali TaxID=2949643 RepID=A0A9X2H923_9MICC|nr:hypothetical protein [Rothia santali]MCP3425324.1 hypothetical protein [Rothia santali]
MEVPAVVHGERRPDPHALAHRAEQAAQDLLGRLPVLELELLVPRRGPGGVGMAGFLGWAVALLLPALTGLAVAAAPGGALEDLTGGDAAGLAGSLGFAAVYLVSFLFGGYAAGRSARFAGAKQGVAVWLWQLMGAAVSTVLSMIFADRVPGLPALGTVQAMGADALLWNVLAALCVLAIGLLAAVLGGMWGMRFHHRADRLGFEAR